MTAYRPFNARKRVALAGFGTVGRGVYERLIAAPERFEVVGVLCRNPGRHAEAGGPADLLTDEFQALAPFDLFVEAIGGISPAKEYLLSALARGADVVTANKTLVSRRFDLLSKAAAETKTRLLYSAAVGGGVPMLETVEARASDGKIERIEAVLNGTTNFVLDRIGAGLDTAEAIRLAQEAGFAEADPTADIDGIDAAEKLSLMARRAFGAAIDPDAIQRDRLASVLASDIAKAAAEGRPYKQVASATKTPDGAFAEVRLLQVPASEPLAQPKLEENCLVISEEGGARTVLHGKGAGQGPTADSVLADINRLVASPVLARS